MLSAILLVAQPLTSARATSQACTATEIFLELSSRFAQYVSLRISKVRHQCPELTVFLKGNSVCCRTLGGLTRIVPRLTTLVLFTTFGMGVVCGRAVLPGRTVPEGVFGGEGQGALLLEMGTVRCDGCGEEFLIGHDPVFADKRIAEKQAGWLKLGSRDRFGRY
jgi:hypothetical protein